MRVFSQIVKCQQKKKEKCGAPLLGLAKSIYYINANIFGQLRQLKYLPLVHSISVNNWLLLNLTYQYKVQNGDTLA